MFPRVGLLFTLAACGGGGSDSDGDTDVVADTEDTVDPSGFPADPTPFDVAFSGAIDATLSFSEPTCTVTSNNFRVMWRGTDHEVVLIAETLGQYSGPGTYDLALPNTRAKFQEEAYGAGYGYFVTDAAQGDSFSLVVEQVDPETATPRRAWGTFTAATMHGDLGEISLAPSEIPIWCPDVP